MSEEKIRVAYGRFVKRYKTPNGMIRIYPKYEQDLELILKFVKEKLNEDGVQLSLFEE